MTEVIQIAAEGIEQVVFMDADQYCCCGEALLCLTTGRHKQAGRSVSGPFSKTTFLDMLDTVHAVCYAMSKKDDVFIFVKGDATQGQWWPITDQTEIV